MNRVTRIRSLLIRAVVSSNGVNYRRCFTTSSYHVVNPFEGVELKTTQQSLISMTVSQWRKAMSTEAGRAVQERDKNENPVEGVKTEDGMVISSYWGISRTKITREDGSVWPWNCLMRKHAFHAVMLETVAAVPGMVGGMLLHLRSLRKFQHSGGWIKALLEEAENERMHLMTMMELMKPN
ncbi:hypothetical protein Ancab_017417 [Ancistrocladus abbreviatus]